MLQQGNDEPAKAYLHRAQDILECIHHTNDMTSISAIGTNPTKILTGLKDGRLCNKLVESKAKMDKHGAGSARHHRHGC